MKKFGAFAIYAAIIVGTWFVNIGLCAFMFLLLTPALVAVLDS